jgi:hypothetical protein
MHRRQTSGTKILVETFAKHAVLGETIGELDLGAVANGPVPAADALPGLEQGAGVAQFAQLVRGHQAGNAPAQDHHTGTFAGACRVLDGGCCRSHDGQQPEGLHHREGGAVPAGPAYPHQKITPA